MARIIAPFLFGLIGTGVLLWLGGWQLQRLEWKQGVLAEIDSRIGGAPVALPASPTPDEHRYLPVALTGTAEDTALRVLVSVKRKGPGYRLVSAFETTDGRRILLDRGFAPVQDTPDLRAGPAEVQGNLHWPDDRNDSIPDNDVAGNTWFARDLDQMASVLGTDPLLVVARSVSPADPGVTPLPVDSSGIPNDHLQYAITWFLLAGVWIVMTGVWIRRITQKESTAP